MDLKVSELVQHEQLKKAGLPPIDLGKPVPSSADTAQTTSQDRDKNEE